MNALLIAFASAVAYVVSDFVGGLRSRSAHFVWVTLVSQCVLTVGVIGWVLGFRPGTPTPSAIAGAIELLTSDRDLAAELGANGRQRAAELSWDAAADEWRSGIERVLA